MGLQPLTDLELNEVNLNAFCSIAAQELICSHIRSLQIKGVHNVHVFLKKVKFDNLETLKLISCGITSPQLINSGVELLKLRHLNVMQNAIDDAVP